jgi:putative transposase
MLQAAGNARWAWNWGLAKKQEAYKATGKTPSAIDLHRELNLLKKKPIEDGGVPWMYEASKCAPQEALRDLDQAFKRFFDRVKKGEKPGYPKFKNKNRGIGGFRLTDHIIAREDSIKLPSLGRVRLMPGEKGYLPLGKHSQASITEDCGRWFVSVVGPDFPEAEPNGFPSVGLDMGVAILAALSDGTMIENPKALGKVKKKLKRFDQALSRKQPESNNRRKAKAKRAGLHRRVRNVRRDALHKASTMLTKSHGQIAIEALKVKNMVKSGGTRKRGLNRVMHDASLGEFRRQLEYKGKRYGCEIVAVPPQYTSQRCSSCGHVDAGNRASQSVFKCLSCGFGCNADTNAAINILAAASWPEAQNACGGGVSPDSRQSSLKQESKQNPDRGSLEQRSLSCGTSCDKG